MANNSKSEIGLNIDESFRLLQELRERVVGQRRTQSSLGSVAPSSGIDFSKQTFAPQRGLPESPLTKNSNSFSRVSGSSLIPSRDAQSTYMLFTSTGEFGSSSGQNQRFQNYSAGKQQPKNSPAGGAGNFLSTDYESPSDVYVGGWMSDKRHGRGICDYANGNRYEGEWAYDQRHGTGTLFLTSGSRYQGQWVRDEIHGKGVAVYSEGDIFDGEWEHNKRANGSGRLLYANGDIYTGSFVNEQRHGFGELLLVNGDYFRINKQGSYDGEWANGLPHGIGCMKYCGEIIQFGFYYEGMWKNNRRFGEGIQRYKNGDCFRGVWIDGFREGAGILDKKLNEIDVRQSGQKSQNRGSWMFVSPQNSSLENKSKQNEQSPQQNQNLTGQGCQVEGVWKHGKINGDVIIRFKNGDIDFAQFEYGIRNRRGKRIFSNGDSYTAESYPEVPIEGEGIYESQLGDIYEGSFSRGVPNGFGILKRRNGDVYRGQWINGKEEGDGVYIGSQGGMYKGEWKSGKWDGFGELRLTNGEIYIGQFQKGKKQGRGRMEFSDGSVYDGFWANNKRQGDGAAVWVRDKKLQSDLDQKKMIRRQKLVDEIDQQDQMQMELELMKEQGYQQQEQEQINQQDQINQQGQMNDNNGLQQGSQQQRINKGQNKGEKLDGYQALKRSEQEMNEDNNNLNNNKDKSKHKRKQQKKLQQEQEEDQDEEEDEQQYNSDSNRENYKSSEDQWIDRVRKLGSQEEKQQREEQMKIIKQQKQYELAQRAANEQKLKHDEVLKKMVPKGQFQTQKEKQLNSSNKIKDAEETKKFMNDLKKGVLIMRGNAIDDDGEGIEEGKDGQINEKMWNSIPETADTDQQRNQNMNDLIGKKAGHVSSLFCISTPDFRL
ncbi:MAG: putative 2-isopropylmalate synthase [Streblomastix strix]|uniref:Putative 2-isopropylmalate synthase n=1 Tax=Streblomastix strix TaxID=222440 RepID=A0A5J4X4C7_9EUKA|nr:MAG: putative 2-isopropylmalate synthase [Streblomastix strix]